MLNNNLQMLVFLLNFVASFLGCNDVYKDEGLFFLFFYWQSFYLYDFNHKRNNYTNKTHIVSI